MTCYLYHLLYSNEYLLCRKVVRLKPTIAARIHPLYSSQSDQMSALRPPRPLLMPTYHGHVSSAKEALILIEACLSGQLSHASTSPLSSVQDEVVSSGNVFVYEEFSSGIREWKDGREWGPPSHVGGLEVAPLRPPTQINGQDYPRTPCKQLSLTQSTD